MLVWAIFHVVEGELAMLRWLSNFWQGVRGPAVTGARADEGAKGEQAALDFLQHRHGFKLVARNWRSPRDEREEIDLVCQDGDVLVFVEVKARAEGALVPGYYAVDERKKRVLRRAVQAYLAQLTCPPRTFRLDVAEVTLSDRLPAQVMHFENVPLFPKGYQVVRQSDSFSEAAS
ncbi:MAG TPA: YraN family protein [Lacunisphaera sp.]|nr:YraN family protein [Lacunisphaera sp.]